MLGTIFDGKSPINTSTNNTNSIPSPTRRRRTLFASLPMSDLLFLGCSDILENESGNAENPPLFRTGLGKFVAVKQSSIEKARSVLGYVDDEPTNTGNFDEGGNGFTPLNPMYKMGSLKSAAMLSSKVQNTSESAGRISNSMFQTGSGKAVNISLAGLQRAKALLGLDENSDRESLRVFEQSNMQPADTKLLARENPSHLENANVCNLHLSTTESLASFGVNLCRSESKKFSHSVTDAKPSPIKFHTAGGRSITVSTDALQRARSLLGNFEIDSVANEESTADPVSSVIADQKRSCPDQNHDFSSPFLQKGAENGFSSSRNFTSPLTTYSYQKNQKPLLGKFRKIVPGNNLVKKFDAEAATNTAKRSYSGQTCDREHLKENSFSMKLDCFGNTAQPKNDPLNRPFNGALVDISNVMCTSSTHNKQYGEKRRSPTMNMSGSPFKKPRGSFITPFNKNNSSATNDLSRLAPKESCSKQRASTRYSLQVPRKYLREFVLQPPFQEKLDNLPEHVKRMNPVAAESYIFQNEMSSGCYGVEAFYRTLSHSGASTQNMTKEWVSNHYKWIVWKLASYERCYPAKFSGKLLLVSNVLEELRYRYEREVNHGHRSAIKKILDGDAPASSTMVLCISSIGGNSDPKFGHEVAASEANGHDKPLKIELTDGWYSVIALLDELLSQKLVSGKLFLGQKLKICGAKLCGWLGPISPLEASQTSLLLHINGTYRCHWAEKLGFCKNACIPLAFKCIKSTGGVVPSTFVGLTRIYPILYRERLSDGYFVVRSKRMEAKAVQLYNQRRDAIAEEIISAFQRETDFDVGNDHGNEEGAKIMKLLETAAEPEVLMAGMSSKQLSSFASYKAKLEAMRQLDMQKSVEKALEAAGLNNRDVTPFMRGKVVGLKDKFHPQEGGPQQGLITIWNPTPKEILELCEGQAYAVGNLLPSGSDSSNLYLQTRGSTSNWIPLSPMTMEKYYDSFRQFFTPRSATKISSLGKVPISSEFDIAAFVVYVGEVYRQGHQQKQWAFVTDGSTSTESCGNRWQEQDEEPLLAINLCLPGHTAAAEVHSCAPVNSNIAGSVVGFCNLTMRPRDRANGLWVAEATENSDYFTSYDDSSCKHLKETAACVLNWARVSSSMVQKHEKRVQCILQNTKDGY